MSKRIDRIAASVPDYRRVTGSAAVDASEEVAQLTLLARYAEDAGQLRFSRSRAANATFAEMRKIVNWLHEEEPET